MWLALLSLVWALLATAGLTFAASLPAQAAGLVYNLENPEKVSRLTVTLNKSQTIRIEQPFAEALVGNSEVADVIPLTDRTLYVLGKQIGGTRLSILDSDKKLLGIMEIEVTYDAAAIERHFEKTLPGAQIKVSPVNGKILLTGYVPNAIALEKAVAIASQYAPDAVTNSLSVAGSQQVMLEVRFIEASRDATRNLGVSWNILNQNNPSNFSLNTNLPGGVGLGAFPTTVLPFGAMVARLLNGGTTADVVIQALEEKGLARRLAEPNLVALSGDTASFLAGGEFPFPIARGQDDITIEFKKFGVGLAFTPTVLANGLINLKIEPEVSEIDPTNTLVVNDTTIPGLVTRRAKTTIELRDGQSFAIAGLLQSNHSKARRQLPWIGQVPVLGSLFRSASYERRETDLVIIVTPRLVQPAGPGDRLVTPFDKHVPANDIEFFLNGKDEKPAWKAHVARTRRAHRKQRRVPATGHMLDAGAPAAAAQGGGLKSYKGAYEGVLKQSRLESPLVTGSLPEATAGAGRKGKWIRPASSRAFESGG
ncbi:MAG: type II and III secretion system protein family protein, partial [Alphaproteobacteria bacterium]